MLGYAPKDGVALLCSILGVATLDALPANPEERRRRTLNFLSEVIVHLAKRDTSLIVFEDLDFADSSTIELITLIVHRLHQTPALLLLTFRPSFDPPWKALPHVTLITLNPLALDEARHLVKAVAGERHLLPETEDEIIARCDGVPLFVEELTKSVIETIDQADNHVAIPMTLRDTLAARLDVLDRAKRVAQVASIIGREFSYRVLESLVPEHDGLAEDLERLESAELITRRGEPPEARYLFKHALVQEAAYESLLLSDRRSRHTALGEQLAQRTIELSATTGLIALHFERGGELNRALEYRQAAGTEAAKASALVEAEEHFSKALENLSSLPGSDNRRDRRAGLLLLLGAVQMPLYGFPSTQVHETYSDCYDLLRSSTDLSKRFDATWGLWLNRCIAGQLDQARRLTRELESIAHSSGDRGNELQAHHAGWTNVAITGELSEAFAHINAGLKLYNLSEFGDHCFRHGGHDPGICARAHGALCAWQLGFPDKAKEHCLEGIELAKSLRHPTSSGVAASFGAIFYQYIRNPRAILDFDAEATPAPAHIKMIMRALKGWAMVQLGETKEGLRVCRKGVESYRDLGATARLGYISYLLADACLYAGAYEEALAEIESACRQKSDITTKSERLRLKGEILQCLGQPEQAEQIYTDALVIAQKQGAIGWQLRTATNLSQFWLGQGRRGEARELLAPIYDGFTEGFDTPDLKRAKVLLDQLAAN